MSILEMEVPQKIGNAFEEALTELRFKIAGLKIISSAKDRIKNLKPDLDKLKVDFKKIMETDSLSLKDCNRLRKVIDDLIEEFDEVENGGPGED